MSTMLVDYLIRRGRIFADIRDVIALLHSHPEDTIDKKELIKALNDWHNNVVKQTS